MRMLNPQNLFKEWISATKYSLHLMKPDRSDHSCVTVKSPAQDHNQIAFYECGQWMNNLLFHKLMGFQKNNFIPRSRSYILLHGLNKQSNACMKEDKVSKCHLQPWRHTYSHTAVTNIYAFACVCVCL